VSPILVRPVREQLEHDRLIRHLQLKYKRKFDVTANVGDEQVASVKISKILFFPDLVLMAGKKLAGLIEVETAESVNNLEAMAQWVHFSSARVPFYLFVPVQAYEAARRFCGAHRVRVREVWTYRPTAEGFDLVRMFVDSTVSSSPRRVASPAGRGTTRKKPRQATTRAKRPAKSARTTKRPARPTRQAPTSRKRQPSRRSAGKVGNRKR
jgi:hypothetical protein